MDGSPVGGEKIYPFLQTPFPRLGGREGKGERRGERPRGIEGGVGGPGRPDPREGGGGLDPVHEDTLWGRNQRKGSYSWSTRREPGGWAPRGSFSDRTKAGRVGTGA